jgi:hypothetical protein
MGFLCEVIGWRSWVQWFGYGVVFNALFQLPAILPLGPPKGIKGVYDQLQVRL